ncbi:MAG: hypothetical protein AAGG68_25355 [Bacteroidota bacterium]
MKEEQLYQSILKKLSSIPPSHLKEVDRYLSTILKQSNPSKERATKILSFAGSWSDEL